MVDDDDVVATVLDVLLAIIDLIGLELVEEGGFSLLDKETFSGVCFKRELFVNVRRGN